MIRHRLNLIFPNRTTYYFDNTKGNDSNSGRIMGFPLKTISRLNAMSFKPGDKILFKRGETWRETLTPTQHMQGYVDFNAYGDGINPIISGSSLTHSLYLEYPFFTFKNITFSGATGATNETARVLTHDLIFINCEFNNSGSYIGFGAWSQDGSDIYNLQLINCNAHDNYTSGVFIGSDTGVKGVHDCLINGGSFYSNGHSVDLDHGIYVKFGVTVRKVTAYNNSSAGIKVNCEGVYNSPYSPLVDSCNSYNNYFGYYVGHNKATIQNSIGSVSLANNMYFDSDARDTHIYNNTMVNSANTCVMIDANVTGAHNIIKNNIFVEDPNVTGDQYLVNATSITGLAANNTFDYNSYYIDGNAATPIIGSRTLASWKSLASSPDAHSMIGSPTFKTNYSNLHLQTTSPCKYAGTNLGIWVDYDGIPRNSTPSIGAYEFV